MKTAKQVLTEALDACEKQVLGRVERDWFWNTWRCLDCKAAASRQTHSKIALPHKHDCPVGRDLADFARARQWLEEAGDADQTA